MPLRPRYGFWRTRSPHYNCGGIKKALGAGVERGRRGGEGPLFVGAGGEEGGVEAEDFVAALHRKGGFAVASHGTCNEGGQIQRGTDSVRRKWPRRRNACRKAGALTPGARSCALPRPTFLHPKDLKEGPSAKTMAGGSDQWAFSPQSDRRQPIWLRAHSRLCGLPRFLRIVFRTQQKGGSPVSFEPL